MAKYSALYNRMAKPPVMAGALLVITLLLFWESQYYGYFIVDDLAYVSTNPITIQGLTVGNIITVFSEFQISNYHPLTMISLMLDSSLFGLDPSAFHRTNIFLHAANAILLFSLLWTMTRALWPSAAVAMLFVVHPIHVEPVVWISSRKDLLSTFFMLCAIAAYIRFVRTRSLWMYGLVCGFFACALLSKQMPVTLPFILLLLDYWPLNRIRLERQDLGKLGPLVLEKIPLFVMAAVFSVIVVLAQRTEGALLSIEAVPLYDRIKNTPLAYVMYLIQTVVPVRLQAMGYRIPYGVPVWQALGCAALLLAITAVCLKYLRKAPYLSVGWFFYLGTFVPVIGLVTLGSTYRADRYAYIPLIGIFIIAAWGIARLLEIPRLRERRQAIAALLAAILFGYTAAAWVQVGKWRDNVTMLEHVLALDSGHHLAKVALADFYFGQGKLMQATEIYLDVARTSPPAFGYASIRLGTIQFDLGHYDRAEVFFEKGIIFEPDDIRGIIGLARTKVALGKLDEAEQVIIDALDAGNRRADLLQTELERIQNRGQ